MIHQLKAEELSLTREPAYAFFSESGIDGIINFPHFCQTWAKFIELDIGAIFVYIDPETRTTGIIGGLCTPCTMTGDLNAQETFWWVEPRLRGSAIGVRLLKQWEKWAIGKGAKRIFVGNLWKLNNSTMRHLYARLGYTPTEVHYIKPL